MGTCMVQTRPLYQFDAEYLRELRNGSSKTLEHFVDYFSAALARKFRKYRVSPASIDDICQETLVRVLASLKGEQGPQRPASLGAFVISVGINVYREFCRGVNRAAEASCSEDRFYDKSLDPECRVLNGEVREQIRQTLDRLSPIDRQILTMALAEDHPRQDICRALNVKPEYLPVL